MVKTYPKLICTVCNPAFLTPPGQSSDTDTFATTSSDILHQMDKGVFKDHLVVWVSRLDGKKGLDRLFSSMSQCHGLRHFKSGVSILSQWTGAEVKEIEKPDIVLGVVAG